MSRRIVVVGSLNIDLVASVPRMPHEGETLTGESFATYPGGKGANQAVCAARLGADVVMVGRLGSDSFSASLRKELQSIGVDTTCVRDVSGASGCAVILVTPEGGNSIVVIPGANATLKPSDLEPHVDLIRDAGVVLAQLEIPLETVERLGQIANSVGVPFVLDPAPAQPLSPAILSSVTWLTPNESETRAVLQYLGHSTMNGLVAEDEIAMATDQILASGVRNVILKLGDRGIYIKGKDVAATYLPTYQVRAVDTTAAGDAFNGGFAYGLTQGMAPLEAAQFACAVAAVSVTRVGAQPSMPKLAEVEMLMAASSQETDCVAT